MLILCISESFTAELILLSVELMVAQKPATKLHALCNWLVVQPEDVVVKGVHTIIVKGFQHFHPARNKSVVILRTPVVGMRSF